MELNRSITLVGAPFEPWVSLCIGENDCKHPGVNCFILGNILHTLKVKDVRFVRSQSVPDSYRFLRNGSADMVCNGDRLQTRLFNEFGSFLIDSNRPILIIKETLSDRLESDLLTTIFDWKLGVLILLCLALPWMLSRRNVRLNNDTILTTSFLVLSILCGVYSNFLSIALSRSPAVISPFRNELDMFQKVARNVCRFTLQKYTTSNSITQQFVQPSLLDPEEASTIEAAALDAFRTNPPFMASTPSKMIEKIKGENCYIGVDWELAKPFWNARFCGIHFLDLPYGSTREFSAFIYHRKDCEACELVRRFLSQGSSQKLWLDTLRSYAAQQENDCWQERTGEKRPIFIDQIQDTLGILVGGTVAGLVVFFAELKKRL